MKEKELIIRLIEIANDYINQNEDDCFGFLNEYVNDLIIKGRLITK